VLPLIEQLLVLQDRDRRLIRLQAELNEIPIQRKRLQDKAAAAQGGLEAAKLRARQIESDKRKLELEVQSKEEFMRKCESLQGQTKSNEEYRRYAHQIDTTKGEIHALEDQEIGLMERAEGAARELAAATREAAQLKADADKLIADLSAREARVQRDFDTVTAERERLAERIDEIDLNRYERILEKKGDVVVVGVKGSICGGCHMKLPQQSFVEAKGAQSLVFCQNCGRILYHTRDMDPEPGEAAERRDRSY
jgi:predicted  nucleic acid-binding Zn-ribbon protein